MKLILENFRNFLNEDLLIESYDDAIKSVVNRATKLVKGWAYNNDKQKYDNIEKLAKESIADTYDISINEIGDRLEFGDIVFSWRIGGFLILSILKNLIIPRDITDQQKKISLLWAYNQFINNKFNNSLDDTLRSVHLYISTSYSRANYSRVISSLLKEKGDTFFVFTTGYMKQFLVDDFSYHHSNTHGPVYRAKAIENFFHWNRFIRDGKKDLNSVVDFEELFQLVEEAKPLYQEWQKKQEDKDAEAGQEVLLDDTDWKIIAIHNKGAACKLGKGTEWCTAAPGLNYFKEYYRPNDPLFFILDKINNARYQFHFGSDQYMDVNDMPVSDRLEELLMYVLAPVVPEEYDIAYEVLRKYKT